MPARLMNLVEAKYRVDCGGGTVATRRPPMGISRASAAESAREQLLAAVRNLETSRARLRPSAYEQARNGRSTVVHGRWTLVDRFESDGRRYVVAFEAPVEREELSSRERQVLRLAASGSSNKDIARELGLAHATVRVLVHRAARKLGARTREQLLAKIRARGAEQPAGRQFTSAP